MDSQVKSQRDLIGTFTTTVISILVLAVAGLPGIARGEDGRATLRSQVADVQYRLNAFLALQEQLAPELEKLQSRLDLLERRQGRAVSRTDVIALIENLEREQLTPQLSKLREQIVAAQQNCRSSAVEEDLTALRSDVLHLRRSLEDAQQKLERLSLERGQAQQGQTGNHPVVSGGVLAVDRLTQARILGIRNGYSTWSSR